jgi:hypothetical protein
LSVCIHACTHTYIYIYTRAARSCTQPRAASQEKLLYGVVTRRQHQDTARPWCVVRHWGAPLAALRGGQVCYYICMCMYVCVYVHMYMCACVCVCVCVSRYSLPMVCCALLRGAFSCLAWGPGMHVYVCMYVYMCICTYLYMCVCVLIFFFVLQKELKKSYRVMALRISSWQCEYRHGCNANIVMAAMRISSWLQCEYRHGNANIVMVMRI